MADFFLLLVFCLLPVWWWGDMTDLVDAGHRQADTLRQLTETLQSLADATALHRRGTLGGGCFSLFAVYRVGSTVDHLAQY